MEERKGFTVAEDIAYYEGQLEKVKINFPIIEGKNHQNEKNQEYIDHAVELLAAAKKKRKSYNALKVEEAPMVDCFFAFSEKQMQEGIKEMKLEGKKLYDGGAGLVGTDEGISAFYGFYEKLTERVKENCTPQEIYDHEFENHECGYICEDTEAVEVVLHYFGVEGALTVKRKYAYGTIQAIQEEVKTSKQK